MESVSMGISLSTMRPLKFSNVNTTYKIKQLMVRNGQASIYLAPGDYWIETLDLDGRKLLLSEPGTTRIFVKNYLSVKNQATLNEDNTESGGDRL